MRNFFTLFKLNIKNLWETNRFILILIVSFMIISFTSIPIAFNSINCLILELDGHFIGHTFSFELLSTDNLENSINKFLNDNKKLNIQCLFLSSEFENLLENENNQNSELYSIYTGELITYGNVCYGDWFSEEDLKNGENVVVVPNYSFFSKTHSIQQPHKYENGSTMNIKGKDYTVIGQLKATEYVFVVPYNSLENKDDFNKINIVICKRFTETQINKIIEKVEKYFDCRVIEKPDARYLEIESALKFVYSIILSVGIVNLVFIYRYLLYLRKGMFGLFKAYGMNKTKCILYLLFEFLIWLLVCYFVSAIIMNTYLYVAIEYFGERLYYFSVLENLSFLLIYLVIYFVCFFPSITKFIERNNELYLINNIKGE